MDVVVLCRALGLTRQRSANIANRRHFAPANHTSPGIVPRRGVSWYAWRIILVPPRETRVQTLVALLLSCAEGPIRTARDLQQALEAEERKKQGPGMDCAAQAMMCSRDAASRGAGLLLQRT